MIDGKILFSREREAEWLQRGLEREQRMQGHGWACISEHIGAHCRIWNFGAKEQNMITEHMRKLFSESRKFLDLDIPIQTDT